MDALRLIQQRPTIFLIGFLIAVLGCYILFITLADRSLGAFMGVQAAYQGAVYLITYRMAEQSVRGAQ